MKQVMLRAALVLHLLAQGMSAHAQLQTRDPAGPRPAMAARVVEVKGNTVVIANASGRRQTLQLTSAHGIKPGVPSGWCEEDCRAVRIGETSYAVKGRAPIK